MGREHYSREPAEVRRGKIVALVVRRGFARPSDIAEEFSVSEETGRRDLAALSQSGQLKRVHGGAVPPGFALEVEPTHEARSVSGLSAKQEIASTAAALVGSEDTVFLDVGTTNEKLSESLAEDFRGTVITNSLSVAVNLADHGGVTVHVVGGMLRNDERTTYGPDALEAISSYHADVAFIGCGAVHSRNGVTDYTAEDIPLKRAMIANSARSYVLATSDKIGKTATRTVCPLSAVSGVITDSISTGPQADSRRSAGVLIEPEKIGRVEASGILSVVDNLGG